MGRPKGSGSGGKARGLMADRLLAMLDAEVSALEAAAKDRPAAAPGAAPARRRTRGEGPAGEEAETAAGPATGSAKARVEAISQVTRTLEKLLELKRLEALAMLGGEDADSAETLRLRDEMMKRLRALDARRRDGAGLFGPDGTLGGVPAAPAAA